MSQVTESCSWCHEMNDIETQFCWNCGHEAHVPRMSCSCASCSRVPVYKSGTSTTDDGDLS